MPSKKDALVAGKEEARRRISERAAAKTMQRSSRATAMAGGAGVEAETTKMKTAPRSRRSRSPAADPADGDKKEEEEEDYVQISSPADANPN